MSDTKWDSATREWIGVVEFTADELRAVASMLGYYDSGAEYMMELADRLDSLNKENDE